MRRATSLYQTSIGKKILMALSGALLFGFVIAHMAGNLKIYQGAEKYDAYAQFLHEVGYPIFGPGQLLWVARIGLLAAVMAHVVSAIQVTRLSHAARKHGYKKRDDLSFSYASRTMRWGGVIITAFIVYHLLHLTVGSVHPEFSHESVYRNVVSGFSAWPASVAYVLAMLPLGFHIYHGLWSATQTLALQNPKIKKWRRPFAAAVALAIVIGNISIPLAVLTGIVR